MRNIYALLLLLLLLLLALLAAPGCWCLVGLRTPSYFHLVLPARSRLSWREARSLCSSNFMDLAIIRSSEENKMIGGGGGWIGLYRQASNTQWRWTATGQPLNFTSWNTEAGQPKESGNCAAHTGERGLWYSDTCDTQRNAVCSQERLLLVQEEKSWEEALEHCRALRVDPRSATYQLATLRTADDLALARERARGASTREVWSGLRHLAGDWLWMDGETTLGKEQQQQRLPTCPASGSCGAVQAKGSQAIRASDCALRRNFLCSKKQQSIHIRV